MADRLKEIEELLPDRLKKSIFEDAFPFKITYDGLEEIRLRCMQPVEIRFHGRDYLSENVRVYRDDIRRCLEYMSNYSLYAFQEDIKHGYITVRGGHRVGVLGKAMVDKENVVGQQFLSFLNIRVAHELPGCADKIMNFVYKNNCLKHTLIVSPPGCGKTTLLRDIIRQLSVGTVSEGRKVCVIDERSEIAGCLEGIPQNDLGPRTDVIDGCPKADGMLMVIRAMSPDIVAIDEIGGKRDIEALQYIVNCGCTVIGTIHAASIDELYSKPDFAVLLKKGIFTRFILLSGKNGAGTVLECRELAKAQKG